MKISYYRHGRGRPAKHPLCRNGSHMKTSRGHCVVCKADGEERERVYARDRYVNGSPDSIAKRDARNARSYQKRRGTDGARVEDNLKHRLRKYGLTRESLDGMWRSSGGSCEACGFKFMDIHDRKMSIDHCHDTGQVRALLCSRCNTLEGKLRAADDGTIKFLLSLSRSSASS